MKKIFFISILAFVFFYEHVEAQQDPQFSMYMFNGQYINPGYVGSKGVADVSAIYRNQWAGFGQGSPHSANIGLHTPFKKEQYAAGILVGYDRIGYTNMMNVMGQFAYRIPIKKSTLSLGVQAGFNHYNDNRTSAVIINPDDRVFSDDISMYVPNVGGGAYLYGERYYVGISVPHILNMSISERLSNRATNDNFARQYRHVFATAGVVIGKDHSTVKFKPSFLMKYVTGLENNIPDFDLNASLLFVDRFWVGASLRAGGNRVGPYFSDVVGIFEMLITQQLRVGYAYDYVISDLGFYTHGTHEIMIGYQFGYQKKKFVNVRYGTYF